MGACLSSSGPSASKPAAKASSKPPPKPRKKINPADYVISKKNGEAIVKAEGSIDGEQFNIEECKDCDIFLMDHIATTFVDDCENCRIFVGPVESSIMVRNCKKCDFVIACQQFRSRDCEDCRCALLCTTEPIIETSTNMQFACFEFSYFSLRQQLGRAGLKLWNNKWWQVYDFNKNPDKPNWSLLPQEDVPKLLRMEACAGNVSTEEAGMDQAVPVTLGCRPWPSRESCFLAFLPDSENYIEQFLATAQQTEGWALARTRAAPMDEERLKTLFAFAQEPKLIAQCKNKDITGIEVCGDGVYQQIQERLASLFGGSKCVRVIPQAETTSLAQAFFETWKDEI